MLHMYISIITYLILLFSISTNYGSSTKSSTQHHHEQQQQQHNPPPSTISKSSLPPIIIFNNGTKYHTEYKKSYRYVKNNFLTKHELETMNEFMTKKEKEFGVASVNGWTSYGMTSIMNQYFCKKDSLRRELTSEEESEKRLLNNMLKLFERTKRRAETYFNTSLAFFQVTINIREYTPDPFIVEFAHTGKLRYNLNPHCDGCVIGSDSKRAFCGAAKGRLGEIDADYYYGQIDYTALIYLNELSPKGGGDFVFFDLPKPVTRLPKNYEFAKCDGRKSRCDYFYSEAKPVPVSPAPGKLVMFDAKGQNPHSVMEVLGDEKRVALSLFFTKMEKVDPDNFPPGHWSTFYYSFKRCYDDYNPTPENHDNKSKRESDPAETANIYAKSISSGSDEVSDSNENGTENDVDNEDKS